MLTSIEKLCQLCLLTSQTFYFQLHSKASKTKDSHVNLLGSLSKQLGSIPTLSKYFFPHFGSKGVVEN